MLTRCSDTKLKNIEENISFKYHAWYENCNEELKYVCYCNSNVLLKYNNEFNESV